MIDKKKRYDYINKYKKENVKRIPLEVTKEKYETIKEHASSHNESVNGFIKRAIDNTIKEDIENDLQE